jgi:hypothetical protein
MENVSLLHNILIGTIFCHYYSGYIDGVFFLFVINDKIEIVIIYFVKVMTIFVHKF